MAEECRIDKKVKIIWMFPYVAGIIIIWLISTAILFAAADNFPIKFVSDLGPLAGSLVVFILCVIIIGVPSYIWTELEYKNFTYQIGENEFVIKEGIISRKRVVIPYKTIDNIGVRRSLAERLVGLSTIELDTAGSDIVEGIVPGISDREAILDELHKKIWRGEKIGGESKSKGTDEILREILRELKEIKTVVSINKTQECEQKSDVFAEVFKKQMKKKRK